MTDEQGPEQIAIMKQVLAAAEKQTELSEERTKMAADRSRMSADRSRMSAERSEMSQVRSYHNAERTLSVWVRTALSLMVLGIAMDRFGLLLHRVPIENGNIQNSGMLNSISTWSGAALVVMGIFMTLVTGWRFWAYSRQWRKNHELPPHHGPFLATFFAVMTAIFGILLLVLMLAFAG
ncbi:MAG TPA: DUF202 domain-containing protein [Gammaproteobacteria bacterium]|nr:DUF202 domain-containing protein [Gammaproteobacteria bacterium]